MKRSLVSPHLRRPPVGSMAVVGPTGLHATPRMGRPGDLRQGPAWVADLACDLGRGAGLENRVPPLRCVSSTVCTVHKHRCLHTTRRRALGHAASERRATFLLAGPGGSLSLRWSDSGVGGCTATHCGGPTPSLPARLTPGCGGLGSGGSLLWGRGAPADRCPLWSQITKLKTDRAMGLVQGVTCP